MYNCRTGVHFSKFIMSSKGPIKCLHGRRKYVCRKCNGSGFCVHDRQKSLCRDCGKGYCPHSRQKNQCIPCKGAGVCKHNRLKNRCKECCKDPVKLVFQRMISKSKQSDKLKNRYFDLSMDYLKMMYDYRQHERCSYCLVPMQFIHYGPTLISIERLDNSLGHINGNCLFVCLKCNNGRKNNST